ncbi:MAG: glycoside hydrolase family 127 protein, partial [Tannerella sp.]|nr:glycoside hydrolase family 127 protein [Tannerella sp.]
IESVKGGWDIFHHDFEHAGGTIAICEGGRFPAKSYLLRSTTGELCGNVFWTFLNQQFRLLNPYVEKYAAEIEKSIYNAAAANQCENGDILYHAHLVAPKRSGQNDERNTCCEGQGTRMLGALPEFIYKTADDGVYIDLFNESAITWEQSGEKRTLVQHTEFPYQPEVKLRVSTEKRFHALIRIRVPYWATKPVEFFVNGKREAIAAPGTYVILDRQWKNRDEINFTLPMGFRLTKYAGIEKDFRGKEAYALEYGPMLMAIVGESVRKGYVNIPYTESELTDRLKPVVGKPLHFTVDGVTDKLRCIPYFDVKGELLNTFTCYPVLADIVK